MTMNWKTWTPTIAAMILGGIAAKMAKDAMGHRNVAVAAPNVVHVVVAKAPIQPGQELTAERVSLEPVAALTAPPDAFTDTRAVIGRISTVALTPGQMVVTEGLAKENSLAGLMALVPSGKRALAVDVNETSSLSGMLAPGCHVDVVASLVPKGTDQSISRTIVQNVLVQAVGQRLTAARPVDGDAKAKAPENYRSVTLIVSPHEAEVLQLASTNARMTLVLRGAGDTEEVDSGAGVKLVDLSGEPDDASTTGPAVTSPVVSVTAPAKIIAVATPTVPPTIPPTTQPAGPNAQFRTVEVIRGGNKASTVQFEIHPSDQTETSSNDQNEIVPEERPVSGK
jgi:pilus assembly protein CpaB